MYYYMIEFVVLLMLTIIMHDKHVNALSIAKRIYRAVNNAFLLFPYKVISIPTCCLQNIALHVYTYCAIVLLIQLDVATIKI